MEGREGGRASFALTERASAQGKNRVAVLNGNLGCLLPVTQHSVQ